MSAIRNQVMEQGTTFNKTLAIVDANGSPVNLSGMTFTSMLRHGYSESRAVGEFTVDISDAPGGQVSMSMAATDTAAIYPGRYVYDVQGESLDGTVTRYIAGDMYVTPEATR